MAEGMTDRFSNQRLVLVSSCVVMLTSLMCHNCCYEVKQRCDRSERSLQHSSLTAPRTVPPPRQLFASLLDT